MKKQVVHLVLVVCALVTQPVNAEAPPEGPAEKPAVTHIEAGYDKGFFIRSPDKNYSLNVNGFAQLLYSMNAAGATARHNFDLGLGRLALSGNVFDPKLAYFFQFEGSTFGGTNRISMLDWWMKYTVCDCLSIRAGRGILAYSRQFYTHPGNLLFSDLSVADYAFGLYRAIGVNVGGSAGALGYDVFVTNSVPALDNGSQANFGDAISAGARLELGILGGGYGYMESQVEPSDKVQLSVGAAAAFNTAPDKSGFQNSQAGDRTVNATVDLGFRWKRVSVQAAYYLRSLLNNGGGLSHGYYGQAGMYVLPKRLEVAARISQTMFSDRGAVNASLGNTSEYTGGVNLYLFGHGAKLQMDYTYVALAPFDGGAAVIHRARVQTQVLF